MDLFSLSSILLLLALSFTSPILSISDEPLLISSVVHDEGESCPYTVIVTTSCFSPALSRDEITLALGDAEGNKVVAPRLDQPLSGGGGGFEKCSSDTFQVKGQCLETICSLYIYRSGPDGWIPETVEIYEEGSKSVKFDFNKNVTEDIYVHNYCNNTTGLPPPSPHSPPSKPTVPPPHPPHFPPPPPPHAPPSAASGRGGVESLVVASAAIMIVLAALVV